MYNSYKSYKWRPGAKNAIGGGEYAVADGEREPA